MVPVANGKDANGHACIEAWTQCNYKADKDDPDCCEGCTCVGGPYFAQCTPAQPGGSCSPVPITALATSSSRRPTTSGLTAKRFFGAGGILATSRQPLQQVSTAASLPSTTTKKRLANPDLSPLFATPATTVAPVTSGLQQRSSNGNVATGAACQKIWQQCSGKTTVGGKQVDWPGPFCCEGGCTCENNGNGQYYGQCRPANNGWQCTVPQQMSANGTRLPTLTQGGRLWLLPTLVCTISAALLVSMIAAVNILLRLRGSQRQLWQPGNGTPYSLVGNANAPVRRHAEPSLLEG